MHRTPGWGTALVIAGAIYLFVSVVIAALMCRSSLSDPWWHVETLPDHLWMAAFSLVFALAVGIIVGLLPGLAAGFLYVGARQTREQVWAAEKTPDHA